MRKFLLVIAKIVRFIFVGLRFIANRSLFLISIFIVYFEGNECEKFSDCVVLAKLLKNQPPNSDRYLEYPWVIKNIQLASGKLLDVGSTASMMFRSLLPTSVEVYAIDLNDKVVLDKSINFSVADIRKTCFPDNYFDCVSCVSTLEHIGVVGRYHSDDDPSGDLKAIHEMLRILKVNGSLLLTVPYGVRDLLPINKLYNKERIEKLCVGYEIVEKKYLKFNTTWGFWFEVSEAEAAQTDMITDRWYALCFVKAVKRG